MFFANFRRYPNDLRRPFQSGQICQYLAEVRMIGLLKLVLYENGPIAVTRNNIGGKITNTSLNGFDDGVR